ncbi:glutamate cyclase domain-containing protein [Trinickia mobilis]|uniref:glutamate cyclase domain-containing protein n=1 Tax=Trinickia mobilis TaxID=2816356 RepID=UPI001A8C065D|nr:glutamate cyclase domain-containing protein [Trinickia mobilis]
MFNAITHSQASQPILPERARAWSGAEATPGKSNLDLLLGSYNNRHVMSFFRNGGAADAAQALGAAKHVMVLTGFSVAEGKPETDGPPGAAALGHALTELGKVVTYVTDSTNRPVLKAAVNVVDPNFAQYGRFVSFDAPHGVEGDRQAAEVIDKYKPDAVVAIELPARTTNGGPRRNMRGIDINGFNPPVDGLLLAASAKGITTVGVGDGGNEAGMGGLAGIPKALDGSEMASAVRAGYPVTAWNSNLGAEAIGAMALAQGGALDKLHTPKQQSAMIEATLAAGAVDGVTRKTEAGAPSDDGRSRTGVDGFTPAVHAGMLEMLRNVVQGMDIGMVANKAPRDDKPFLIGAFDSSNGGLIAAKNLASFIETRSPHHARFAIVVDHGNAPYGEKTRDELVKLVGNGMKTAEEIGVDVIAMACNTACTAFPEAATELKKTKVLDLIDVTAKAIAKLGGDRPVILSTPATAKDPLYPQKVLEASDGKVELLARIGAKEWAPLINGLEHLSYDKKEQDNVNRMVDKYVAQIPEEATSVWLCCTHYPALKDRIEDAIKSRGLDIEVIDPMEHQAELIIDHLNSSDTVDRSSRRSDTSPIVVTTGDNVDVSAKALLGREDVLVLKSGFGKDFSMQLLKPHIDEPAAQSGFAEPLRPHRLNSQAGRHTSLLGLEQRRSSI